MTTIFLFGKLPTFGDFVARGLARPAREQWDAWLSAAQVEASMLPAVDPDATWLASRPVGFVLAPLATDDRWQAGCMIASTDRIGRNFPFVLGVSRPARITSDEAGRIATSLAECLGGSRRWASLDALMSAAMTAIRAAGPVSALLPLVDPAQPDWIAAHPGEQAER